MISIVSVSLDDSPDLTELRTPIVLFSGVTRGGHLAGVRLATAALRQGCDVLWFDGHGDDCELDPDLVDDSATVVRVEYADAERRLLLNRLAGASARGTAMSGRRLGDSRFAHVLLIAWDLVRARLISPVLRVIAGAQRGRSGWRLLEPTVERAAATLPTPVAVLCGDDHSVPAAWRAARVWPTAVARDSVPPDLERLLEEHRAP